MKGLFLSMLLILQQPTLGGAMELIALTPQAGTWGYEVRNGSSNDVGTVMIEHKSGHSVNARAPRGWSIIANNGMNVTWIADRGHAVPPNGDLAGFSIQSNADRAREVVYTLTSSNGDSLRVGKVPVPED